MANTAVFTIVRDDDFRLHPWYEYYIKQLPSAAMFVLDHGDTLTGQNFLSCHNRARVVPVFNQIAFSHEWLLDVVTDFHRFLKRSFETVIFAEVDEFLVAHPIHYRDLEAFIVRNNNTRNFRATGYEVLHAHGEPELQWHLPWLHQRSIWTKSKVYSKQLINRDTPEWCHGFHIDMRQPELPVTPSLYMVHTHRMDYAEAMARHHRAAKATWNPLDLKAGRGRQSRLTDPTDCREFCAGRLQLYEQATPEKIPDWVKSVL
jgi:hypothetical protein